MDSDVVVEAVELTRRFGDFTAVDRATFSVRRGEIFAVIGPNGAGKSTLIKMLTTLLPVTSGRASIVGFDLARQPAEVRKHIGYVPQLLSADGSLTGYENLLLSARLYGLPRAERNTRIDVALERMGLTDARDRLVQHYSGGMIRRLEVAQSMLHRPAVLFMDEPTIGLDPVARRSVWAHVMSIREHLRTTVVVTTHYMEEVEQHCDRVALLDAGRIALIGTPAELKTHLGANASLDDVFAAATRPSVEQSGYHAAEEARRSSIEHG
jgi:ABC-2 type transport system ATP-binding protein